MNKNRKPLSTKRPPKAEQDYRVIENWMTNRIMPGIKPIITEIDRLIHHYIPNLQYAIKWGNAYYGTPELGWLIEVAAYDMSANMVFLNGGRFMPEPPLGSGDTRYMKLKTIEALQEPYVSDFIKQALQHQGWQ
jgi:hypothetical protein